MRNTTIVGRGNRMATVAGVLALSLSAIQCNDSPTEPVKVAASNANITLTATTVEAVAGQSYSVPGGGAALGKPALANDNLTVAFSVTGTGTAAVTTTTIDLSGGGQIVATTTFGSCILRVTSSSARAAIAGVIVGDVITINPCSLTLNTAGVVGNGQQQTVNSTLDWGGRGSTVKPLTITISPTGTITVPGRFGTPVTIGVVTTTNATSSGS